MLAKAVTTLPEQGAVDGGWSYEPKWDGFRCIIIKDGDDVDLASRGKKPLTRYFPELVAACREHLDGSVVLDGEVVVRSGEPGAQRLDWEALGQRIHPAESRVAKLSVETPAEFIAFDLLGIGDEDVTGAPFAERRARLEDYFGHLAKGAPLHLTRVTRDVDEARDWFTRFEGAGLDGVVAKALASPYSPGKRTMLKIKHKRTAEAVVTGYRVHKSGPCSSACTTTVSSSTSAGSPPSPPSVASSSSRNSSPSCAVTPRGRSSTPRPTAPASRRARTSPTCPCGPSASSRSPSTSSRAGASGTPSSSCGGAPTATRSRARSTRSTGLRPMTWVRC